MKRLGINKREKRVPRYKKYKIGKEKIQNKYETYKRKSAWLKNYKGKRDDKN